MSGKLRLDQDLTGSSAAAGTAGDLYNRLREALGCAKVSAEQTLVRVQHDNQRYVREVVSLGHHLCTDENTCLTRRHAAHRFLQVGALPDDVTIQADQGH